MPLEAIALRVCFGQQQYELPYIPCFQLAGKPPLKNDEIPEYAYQPLHFGLRGNIPPWLAVIDGKYGVNERGMARITRSGLVTIYTSHRSLGFS